MKTLKMILAGILFTTFGVFSQTDTLIIQTSAQCGMCKERIEKAMAFEKGVISSELNMESKELTVMYKLNRTDANKIKQAISKVGYDAGDVKANPRAYKKLPACCKKPDDPEFRPMK